MNGISISAFYEAIKYLRTENSSDYRITICTKNKEDLFDDIHCRGGPAGRPVSACIFSVDKADFNTRIETLAGIAQW